MITLQYLSDILCKIKKFMLSQNNQNHKTNERLTKLETSNEENTNNLKWKDYGIEP